ncbi:MAG: hypothetical protein LC129_08765, partial [Burkholderiales bacterium]|nr:hypothetical protein [Burkholderiales bacterium]
MIWSSRPGRAVGVVAVLVALATLALFLPLVRHGFISIDDELHLVDNALLLRGSLADLRELWTRPYFGLYVPVTYTAWFLLAGLARDAAAQLQP